MFFTVISGSKITNRTGIVREDDGKKIIGIYIKSDFLIESDTDVIFKYKNSESGASGGLMSALYIYNELTEYDLTKGRNIAGTGTIEYDGTVGEIGGVKYKLLGAVKAKADIFIVPSGSNYEEAKKLVEENNYKIELIEAKTFKDVIETLRVN